MNYSEEILAANTLFYQAFTQGNYQMMDNLWARNSDVSCIHPGWPALTERETIMGSWKAVLEDPPQTRFAVDTVQMHGTSAIVIGIEFIEDVMLATTNFFIREDGEWRMSLHQSSPLSDEIEVVETTTEQIH